jgi:hypothetical protein
MKLLVALCVLTANVVGTAAFSMITPDGIPERPSHLIPSGPESQRALPEGETFELFPTYDSLETLESGGTVRTYQMPSWATRVQYRLETNGRPMKGEVQLWLGPERKTHTMKVDCENGKQFPVQALLKFKKGPPVLKVSTTTLENYPMKVGIHVPSAERALELEAHTESVWDNLEPEEKQLIQGANTDGKYGKRVNWTIPDNVDSVQLLGWNRDSGRKSFKVEIELLQGPNNVRQYFFLQCGGGSQPYHAVYQTPGAGWTVRIRNKKFVEDGLIHIAVKPYETSKEDPTKTSAMEWN